MGIFLNVIFNGRIKLYNFHARQDNYDLFMR